MISILLYHQINNVPKNADPFGLSVEIKTFKKQMQFLHSNGYRCISLGNAVKYFKTGQYPKGKIFALTFDDGYKDLFYNVRPILEKFGFSATIFLVANNAGSKSNWRGQNGYFGAPLLTWKEAKELARSGFTFGSHTLSHIKLNNVAEHLAIYEIEKSKTMIEELIDTNVEFFSYPYGCSNGRIQEIVKRAGFSAACGVDQGAFGLYNIWRSQCCRNDSTISFLYKASGWYYIHIMLKQKTLLKRIAKSLRKKQNSIIF